MNRLIENQNILHENRLPARMLLLPAQKRGVTHKNAAESDRVQLLGGDWRFRWLPEDTDEAFYLPGRGDADWDTLPVPSMWQFQGYGSCYYPNVRYCFPYDPPYIRRDNPVGLYRRAFTARKRAGERAVLRFLGVDNAFFVWLNGEYVGFSKGSRIPAEFDVTAALREGENLLAVKVYTFSDASYLENQDMLMASGIFRDVKLIFTGENSLWDYTLLPSQASFTVRYAAFTGGAPAVLRATLEDPSGAQCACAEQPLAAEGELFLPLENAVPWNAERPALYTLYFELTENGDVTETHTARAGIATWKTEGCLLKLNGSPVTLKGVNRHENNARTGRAITAAQIETELKDIKSCNLNAIRTSHYTNHPVFYELASELGIYVMDEADCETHGAECAGDQGALNKDPAWFSAFFDRVSRMYALHKNETCVNIWSMGNECGAGENSEKCARWLRERPVRKPVRDMYDAVPAAADDGFVQTGYMPMQTLRDTDPHAPHPLVMLEYAHAMGNSPGGLEDIWNWVYENEHCCGGYVWEFKSHGFYAPGKNGRPRYLYGGDFQDIYHWSNFSLDGYHRSDGTPQPSWRELREVSAPVHVCWRENGADVKNTLDFTPLGSVVMRWRVCAEGVPVRSGEVSLAGLAPRAWKTVPLPLETEGLAGLVTADCAFYEGETLLARKQKILARLPVPEQPEAPFAHTAEQREGVVTVKGADFSVVLKNGLLTRLERGGAVLLEAPMRLNCFRAPTDNDGAIFEPNHGREWKEKLTHTLRFGCNAVRLEDGPAAVTVIAEGKLLPFSHYWGFVTRLTYRVTAGGRVDIGVDMEPYGDGPALLPRVGAVFELPAAYTKCRWLGRGFDENYPDCKAHTPVDLYAADVTEMNFLYDVPQETGSRGDCRFVTVSGGGKALTVTGDFAFSFQDFTLEALTEARHCDELEKSENRYLYIDYKRRGLGSHSCGPEPEEEYELRMGAFRWGLTLVPSERDGNAAATE